MGCHHLRSKAPRPPLPPPRARSSGPCPPALSHSSCALRPSNSARPGRPMAHGGLFKCSAPRLTVRGCRAGLRWTETVPSSHQSQVSPLSLPRRARAPRMAPGDVGSPECVWCPGSAGPRLSWSATSFSGDATLGVRREPHPILPPSFLSLLSTGGRATLTFWTEREALGPLWTERAALTPDAWAGWASFTGFPKLIPLLPLAPRDTGPPESSWQGELRAVRFGGCDHCRWLRSGGRSGAHPKIFGCRVAQSFGFLYSHILHHFRRKEIKDEVFFVLS